MLISLVLVLCALGVSGAGPEEANDSNSDKAGGQALRKGPEPGDGERHSDRQHAKRQFYLPPLQFQQPVYPQQPGYPQQQQPGYPQQQPGYPQQQPGYPQQQPTYSQQPVQYPFIPIYIPYRQVVEVHHVVMLQPPSCPPQPRPPTPQTPVFPYPPATQPPTMDTGLDDRAGPMGGQNDTMPGAKRPSRCVWAIVACCSPDSTEIRYSCFELLGCPGAFWGVNPCEPKVVQAAANTALNFYMTAETEDRDFSRNSL